MIARCVHNHTPQAQLNRPEFMSFEYTGNVSDVDIEKTTGLVNPASDVSDVDITKPNEVVPPADAVSDITRSGEESVPKIITHEEIIASAPTSAPTSEIIKPEEITTSTSVSAPPAPQDIEKNATQEQPIVEAVPVAPNQTSSVVVESIDKLADYIAERIKQKLQEHSDNDPFTRVTTANANISQ